MEEYTVVSYQENFESAKKWKYDLFKIWNAIFYSVQMGFQW